jgi:hypothetical protein
MTEQKINKSDYTDRKGVVHDSIGENIRSDNNQLSADYLNSIREDERNMFPFFPFKKGKWIEVTDTITGGSHTSDLFYEYGDESNLVLSEYVKFMLIVSDDVTDIGSISYYPGSRFFNNEIKFVIRFVNPVTIDNDGQRIKMMCYVEDE